MTRKCKEVKNQDALELRIQEYLRIKGIGTVLADACDLILRLRLGQMSLVFRILSRYVQPYPKNWAKARKGLISLLQILSKSKTWDEFKNKKLRDKTWELQTSVLDGYPLGQPVSIKEPLYKLIELGGYLMCREKFGVCPDADRCWVIRRGFCERWNPK